jgi:hypothetical protein
MGVEDFDQQLHDDVKDLIAEGLLERDSDAHGIARQVIARGPNSMTAAQRALFESVVSPALKTVARYPSGEPFN